MSAARVEPLSQLALLLRDGTPGQQGDAWQQAVNACGTGGAHDVWSMAKRELADWWRAAELGTAPAEQVALW